MKLAGHAVLPGPRAKVWEMLTDPVRLAKLLPGCERLDHDGSGCFKVVVKFGIAAISGKYTGRLEYADQKPPHSMRLKLSAKAITGFVDGEARVELTEKGHDTEIHYTGEARVGGPIAAVGQRMMDAAAKRIVGQFFAAAADELKKG
jgi:carbon monoxide dehydrogenase subunit G